MGWFWDHHTETSATPIIEFASPQEGLKARLTTLVYTPAGTVHDLVIMRAIHQVLLTAASAASDTTLDLSEATFGGDTLASGDYVILEHADGTYGMYLASGLSVLVLTVGAIAKAANAGARVWIMGAPGDTSYHSTLKSIASTRTEFFNLAAESGYNIGTFERDGFGDPLAFYSANGTAAGTLNYGSGLYVSN